MNIIIPMAGRGTRIRPHSITTPKPLLPIAGTPIVERLINTLSNIIDEKIESIGFIIAEDFGVEIEEYLLELAKKYNAKGHIYYQKSPEGIAHALLCAKELFLGKVTIALADTLFVTKQNINLEEDAVLFVQEVEDPSQFGVVNLNENGYISELIEKPTEFISNQAIVGVYYFKNGEKIKSEMQYLLDNNIRTKNEFQLTDAIERLRVKNTNIAIQQIEEWLDCGNKKNVINTNKRILELTIDEDKNLRKIEKINSLIIEPCYIGENVTLENCIIGPHVSIGNGSNIRNSIIKKSVVQENVIIKSANLKNSMLGNFTSIKGSPANLSLGDYSVSE